MTAREAAQPFVSIVVPTADRSAVVGACLEHLVAQRYPRYEVIVVDNGSRDGTRTLVKRFAGHRSGLDIRYARHGRQGAGAARNAGIDLARSDLICFVDDDALAPPGWLAALVDGARRHPEAGALGGPVRPRFERPPPPTCRGHELAGAHLDCGPEEIEVDELWGCNMVLRRSAARRVGAFDEGLSVAEDWDWGRRLRAAGGQLVYLPQAWILHRRLPSDLHLAGLVVEHCRRGYVVAGRDPSVGSAPDKRGAFESVMHALRRRCTRGLTDAMWRLGFLAGRAAERSGFAERRRRS